jgi:cytochrome c-type biogenesis protein CcmH
MNTFWFAVAGLSTVALAFMVWPVWNQRRVSGRWSGSGLIAALAVIPVAAALYSRVSTFEDAGNIGATDDQLAMVRQLADKLVQSPDDIAGWQLLGRSYMTLGEYGLAKDAYLEAWQRTAVPNNDLKLGLGEALIWTDPATIRGQAGDLIEDVLATEPTNQRALWWGGLVAAERGQETTARQRWNTLLSLGPPPEVSNLIRQQLSGLSGNSGEVAATTAVATSGTELTLNVSLGEGMSLDGLGPNSYLFVFARAPGGGPPIAGVRHPVDALPGTFTLSDADAIIAGRSLAMFPEISIIARVSISGDPIEQAGDLVAESIYRQGDAGTIELLIDRVVGTE